MSTRTASAKRQELDLNYPVFEGRYDEARSLDGEFREHWRYLFEAIESLGRPGMIDRQLKANRLLRDDGATYSRTSDGSQTRPWTLDPIPLLIDSEAWAGVEQGLSERAELLDLLLRDLYSERAIIRSGVLPPEVILSNPAYLRICHGLLPADEQQLIFHAVDLARGPKGQMMVLSDRTQAPSGAGYSLLNRTVMSRIMPSVLRDSQVHRLAVFFQTLRRQLATLAGESDPRIVVLTPGAFSETYFEHSYLANYLGYSLVQGSDLVVKDGYVWMRSMEGLHRVDVIVRRLDDIWCDPVELKGDSQLGVPGLLEVVRAGNVVLANPLGAGILESPVLLRYMKDISEFYLGRKLQIPSVKTWWLGDKSDCKYALEHLDTLIIKPVVRSNTSGSIFGPKLSQEQLAELKARILKKPENFVAQLANLPSATPSWQRGQLQSLPTILRTFAVADQGSYSLMAGGLTRCAVTDKQSIVSNQAGATSKDTWVIASEQQAQITLRVPGQSTVVNARSISTDLPSRVVENLFWMGRYAERAEASARLSRTLLLQLNAVVPLHEDVKTQLLHGLTDLTATHPGFYQLGVGEDAFDEVAELNRLISNGADLGTLPCNLQFMLQCSDEVRELLSADSQRIISDIREQRQRLVELTDDTDAVAREEALDDLITSLMALNGLTHESMQHSIGWRFLEVGRRIERAMLTASLLRSTLVPVLEDEDEEEMLQALMLSSETLTTYRRRYPKGAKVDTALPIMMFDDANPRSLMYQVTMLEKHLQALVKHEKRHLLSPSQRSLLKTSTELRLAYAEELSTLMVDNKRQKLDDLLASVLTHLSRCAQRVSDEHFEQTRTPQQLTLAASGGVA